MNPFWRFPPGQITDRSLILAVYYIMSKKYIFQFQFFSAAARCQYCLCLNLVWSQPRAWALLVNTWVYVWEQPLGVLVLHINIKWRSRVWGKGRQQESRATDALMRIRLCCCILKEGPRGGKDRMRGDKPRQPDVMFQVPAKDWKDHLTLQRCEICVNPFHF